MFNPDPDAEKWGATADLSSSSDSDQSVDLRAAPDGAFSERSRNAAWAGAGMEEEREAGFKKRGEVAMKEQFYNREVGEGYQHKTVKRQKTAGGGKTGKVVDMTAPRVLGAGGGGEGGEEVKRRALECESVREFKREIQRLIKSAEDGR